MDNVCNRCLFSIPSSVVYGFQCDLCDAGYLGYTRRHLHYRVKGRRKQQTSAIAKRYKNMRGTMPQGLLSVSKCLLKKCRNKFDCFVYEMLFELFFFVKKYLLVGAQDMSVDQWISGSAMYVCHTNQIGSTIKHQSNFLL